MNRFEGKVASLREPVLVLVPAQRAASCRKAHSSYSMDGVNTTCGFDAAQSFVHPGDVSDEEYVKRLVKDTITTFGKLDVFVNNAAIAIFGPFAQTTTQNWRKLMATDLDSVYFACREALPHLLKTKGTIINVSSASGLGGDWGLSSYNAATAPSPTLRAP